ncbi:MAG: sensor histidine kinase [Lachnospiraceae bacterium]|nr:sensor histidine kinase [Lachnospiraceae bacterium]
MSKKKYRTTFSKMTVAFIFFGLIPLLLLSLFFFLRYSGLLRDSMTAAYSDMTVYVANNIEDLMDSVDEAMGELYDYQDSDGSTLAEVLTDVTAERPERELAVREALGDIMAKSEFISSLRLVDTYGNVYSLYYSQGKTLRNGAESFTTMDVYQEGDSLTGMMLFGTFPEAEICVSSEDYIFSLVRNYMDVTSIETTCSQRLATLYADINVDDIEELIEKSSLNIGSFYVYSPAASSYIYSGDTGDYLGSSHPLSFCEELLDGGSGYEKIGSQWVFYQKISGVDAYAVLVMENSDIMGAFYQSVSILILIVAFAGAFLLVLYMVFSIWMSEPTRKLKAAMEEVEQGNLDVRVELDTNDEMEYVADGFNHMTERLTDYINQVYVAQICRQDAEMNALKMQIQPHYLYNSLDIIRMTALEQNDRKTAQLLESLAKQLRYVMGPQSERVCLKDEIDSIREYFVMMRIRYEERISLMIYLKDEDQTLMIPKLILQPMVENAIRHGLREKKGYGAVAIRVERKSDHLEIVVMDDGVGMDEEGVRHIMDSLENHEVGSIESDGTASIGMQNVYDRIKLNCGAEYGYTVQSTKGMGTVITFTLPIWKEP